MPKSCLRPMTFSSGARADACNSPLFRTTFLQLSPTRGERLRRGRRRRDGARGAADGGVQDRSLTGFLPLGRAELAGMVFASRSNRPFPIGAYAWTLSPGFKKRRGWAAENCIPSGAQIFPRFPQSDAFKYSLARLVAPEPQTPSQRRHDAVSGGSRSFRAHAAG